MAVSRAALCAVKYGGSAFGETFFSRSFASLRMTVGLRMTGGVLGVRASGWMDGGCWRDQPLGSAGLLGGGCAGILWDGLVCVFGPVAATRRLCEG